MFILKVLSTSGDWKVGRRLRESGKSDPTPPVFCVNAVDKGVSGRIGVKAVDKGLSSQKLDSESWAVESSSRRSKDCENTTACGEKGGPNGGTVSGTLTKEYRKRSSTNPVTAN